MKGTTQAVVYKKTVKALYKALRKSSFLVHRFANKKNVKRFLVQFHRHISIYRRFFGHKLHSLSHRTIDACISQVKSFDQSFPSPSWDISRKTSHVHRRVITHGTLSMTAVLVAITIVGIFGGPQIVTSVKKTVSKVTTTAIITTAPLPTPTPDLTERMSPADRIGQLFMIRVPGDVLTEETRQFIQKVQPGGIVLMRENISDIAGTKALVRDLQQSVKFKLFVAVDQEGGTVLRLPWDTNTSVAGDHTTALAQIEANTNLAPILDLAVEGAYIHDRAYASDSASITQRSQELVDAQHTANILSVGKHFPGIGRALDDPHARIPLINAGIQELDEDLAPFAQLKEKLDMVMSSHVRYSSLDGANPATFSYQIMTEILRNKVGYRGIAITDDLNMDSVVSQRDKYTRALQAGHDMLLTLEPSIQVGLAIDEVAQATRSGRLRMESIDTRVRRIIELKRTFGLIE